MLLFRVAFCVQPPARVAAPTASWLSPRPPASASFNPKKVVTAPLQATIHGRENDTCFNNQA